MKQSNPSLLPTAAQVIDSSIGPLTLFESDGRLVRIDFGATCPAAFAGREVTPLLREAMGQFDAYFRGQLREFSLPLAFSSTPFREKVWRALMEIPYGEVRSYAQLAAAIGQPKACRAVGGANHHNPLSIVIPCHRVIGAAGGLVGYGGGLAIKNALLELERRNMT